MKQLIIILAVVVGMLIGSANWMYVYGGDEFDPKTDGWYFINTGRKGMTWKLFRETYLGVHPNMNCGVAPLDCAFYELFKVCANDGVCGGMSLLGLALYKYGGYMGYCSPAKFYKAKIGGKAPQDQKLYDALAIMQARQFSASGIRKLLDISNAGNLNNAVVAFKAVKGALAKGDYPLLIIADNYVGERAHTVIPYKVAENPAGYSSGTKIIHIWDPNYPYSVTKEDYAGKTHLMIIKGAEKWTYRDYTGSDGGWCLCMPMSTILTKNRHPMSVGMVATALMTVFVKGTGSAVTQVSDDQGRRLYKQGQADTLETDPGKRIKGIIKWPWFDGQDRGDLPDLYFIERAVGDTSSLNITINGQQYDAVFSVGGDLIQVNAQSTGFAADVIRLSELTTAVQSIEIETSAPQRTVHVMQLRTDVNQGQWRRFDVRNLQVSREAPVAVQVLGNLDAVSVSSRDRAVAFDLDIRQRLKGATSIRTVQKLTTEPGKRLRVAPKDWAALDKTELDKRTYKKKREQKR